MNNDVRISALRIDTYECPGIPRDVLAPYAPKTAIASAWVPQPIADQIWVFYKFPSPKARMAWESGLPNDINQWLDRSLVSEADYWGWKNYFP